MLRLGLLLRAAGAAKRKTLHDMLRKFKVAGAHPDVIYSVDADKARHNGDELIRLEEILHRRYNSGYDPGAPGGGRGDEDAKAPQNLKFWLMKGKDGRSSRSSPMFSAGAGEAHAQLKLAQCTITPMATDETVKGQLKELFHQAGLSEDFDMGSSGAGGASGSKPRKEETFETVMRSAGQVRAQNEQESMTLYGRLDRVTENLRIFGIMVMIDDATTVHLITMPDNEMLPPSMRRGGDYMQMSLEENTVDPSVTQFLDERNLVAFDFRGVGTFNAMERIVSAMERLERMYNIHRGKALRTQVAIILSTQGQKNYVADDGVIVLAMPLLATWDEYLLSLPTPVWQGAVKQHQDWRIGDAPRLHNLLRTGKRMGDVLGFFSVKFVIDMGTSTAWVTDFVSKMMKDEPAIRNTIRKYNMKSGVLHRRGMLRFHKTLTSSGNSEKEIAFKVSIDGRMHINASMVSVPQMLKVLKDNFKACEKNLTNYDNLMSSLERLQMALPVTFSIDPDLRKQDPQLLQHVQIFLDTMKKNQNEIQGFLRSALPPSRGKMMWVISNRFDCAPNGCVRLPYDVSVDSIKRGLLPAMQQARR